jgi:hypothetical protein
MSAKQTFRVEMSPEQALQFARQLTADAHRVLDSRKSNPEAYVYSSSGDVTTGFHFPCEVRVRIGEA